jgi:protein-tyrosine-phosphatase
MEEVMAEKGIDMAFRRPKSLEEAGRRLGKPDLIITMGCEEVCPLFPGVPSQEWGLPDPSGESIDFMRQVRDDVEGRVNRYIEREL